MSIKLEINEGNKDFLDRNGVRIGKGSKVFFAKYERDSKIYLGEVTRISEKGYLTIEGISIDGDRDRLRSAKVHKSDTHNRLVLANPIEE